MERSWVVQGEGTGFISYVNFFTVNSVSGRMIKGAFVLVNKISLTIDYMAIRISLAPAVTGYINRAINIGACIYRLSTH